VLTFVGAAHSRVLVYNQSPELGFPVLVDWFEYHPPGQPGCGNPYDIAVDSQDRIIIAEGSTIDTFMERIEVFDKHFNYVGTYGEGLFSGATGVSVGPGDVIVAVND